MDHKEIMKLIKLLMSIALIQVISFQLVAQENVEFRLTEVEGLTGELVTVDLRVSGLNNGSSFFLTFDWDNDIAEFEEVLAASPEIGLDVETDFGVVNGNRINVTWETSDEQNGTTISDMVIAQFNFRLVGQQGESTPLFFRENETTGQVNEVFSFGQNGFVELEADYSNGQILISSQTVLEQSPTFLLDVMDRSDSIVTVDLLARNFVSASSLFLSIDWLDDNIELLAVDPIELLDVENVSTVGFTDENNRLNVEWTSDNPEGVNAGELSLLRMRFRQSGGDICEVINLEFSDVPERFQFLEYWTVNDGSFSQIQAEYIGASFNFNSPVDLGDDINKCSNESVVLQFSGSAEQIVWKLNGSTIEEGVNTIQATEVGLYSVEITTDNCTQFGQINIRDFSNQTTGLPETIMVSRNDETSVPVVSGGVSYEWSSSQGIALSCVSCIAPSFTTDTTGFINVLITDENGCEFFSSSLILTEEIEIEELQSFISFRAPSCQGFNDGFAEVLIIGGTPPFEVTWDDGSTEVNRNNLAEGEYQVVVRDANNQNFQISASILAQSLPTIDINVQDATCTNDGIISLDITNGIEVSSVQWSSPDINGLSGANIAPGLYSFNLQDEFGCTIVDTIEVGGSLGENLQLAESITVPANVETALPIVEGGVSYQWSSSEGILLSCDDCIDPFIITDTVGFVNVLITDVNGCEFFSSSVILIEEIEIEELQSFISFRAPSCEGFSDGFADVLIIGGLSPFDVLWDDGSIETSRAGLVGGEYQVTIVDAVNQSVTISASITSQSLPTINANIQDVSCANNGIISLDITNDVEVASIVWSDPNIVGLSGTNIAQGTYRYVLTDEFGCMIQDSVFVGSNGSSTLDIADNILACNNSEITIPNQDEVFDQFRWILRDSLIAISQTLLPQTSGTYIIQAIGSDCVASDTVEIVVINEDLFFPQDTIVLEGATLDYVINGIDSISWQSSEDIILSCDDCNTIEISPESSGMVSGSGISQNGCEFQFQFAIDVIDAQPIDPINYLSPNRDGINDILSFEGLENFMNPRLLILNEWGRVIADIENYQNDWSGRLNGKTLPDGVYFYRLSYKDNDFEFVTSSDLLLTNN